MKLMSIPEWQKTYFTPGSAPSDFTVRRLLREDKLPGRKVGGEWFIDDDAWRAGASRPGDPLLRRILDAG